MREHELLSRQVREAELAYPGVLQLAPKCQVEGRRPEMGLNR